MKVVRLSLITIVVVACAHVSGWAQGGVSPGGSAYGIAPIQTYVAPGELCTLSVAVDMEGDSLGCVECWVTFDTNLVSIVDAEEGALFKESGQPGLFFWKTIAADTHSAEGCLLGYRTYALAPGDVARFVFRADAPGVCRVDITRLRLWDIDRELLEPNVDPYGWIVIGGTTDVAPHGRTRALGLDAYPNPFNPTTTLVLSGIDDVPVDLSIYEATGRRVKRLFRGKVHEESARFVWDGRNDAGRAVSSGVYFAVARTDNERLVSKLVLLQ